MDNIIVINDDDYDTDSDFDEIIEMDNDTKNNNDLLKYVIKYNKIPEINENNKLHIHWNKIKLDRLLEIHPNNKIYSKLRLYKFLVDDYLLYNKNYFAIDIITNKNNKLLEFIKENNQNISENENINEFHKIIMPKLTTDHEIYLYWSNIKKHELFDMNTDIFDCLKSNNILKFKYDHSKTYNYEDIIGRHNINAQFLLEKKKIDLLLNFVIKNKRVPCYEDYMPYQFWYKIKKNRLFDKSCKSKFTKLINNKILRDNYNSYQKKRTL